MSNRFSSTMPEVRICRHLFFIVGFLLVTFQCISAIAVEKDSIYIRWDTTTLRKISSASIQSNYNGYSRLIQYHGDTLLSVYEADGNIVCAGSNDSGNSWEKHKIIVPQEEGVNMCVPDILLLRDKSILVCYNLRPYKKDSNRRFAVKTIKSYDGGNTWKDDRLLYEAGTKFEDGCWEPSAIQLPSGEIQLFFANEGIYLNSNEQNISMLRSFNGGLNWDRKPVIVSFRKGKRDGMPVPVILKGGKEIVLAIEDNGIGEFKPYVVRNTLKQNWAVPVTAESPLRTYALQRKLDTAVYAGAPYLCQLKSGETILSYQGTEGRKSNKMNDAEMKVVIGDDAAENFASKSSPFKIPSGKSGLWNSLAVLTDSTIIALTSTNAYSPNKTEVWMIKGRLVRIRK